MSYTYKKVDGQENLYEITYTENDNTFVFSVGATDESQIDELVAFHLNFLNSEPNKPQITYAIQRANSYPTIAEQLDLLYHGGYDGWKEKIAEIKATYPKE